MSFKHRGFLQGTNKPKLPQLYRIRTDLVWEDVVANFADKKPNREPPGKSINGKRRIPYKNSCSSPIMFLYIALPIRRPDSMKPKGYWSNAENRRTFFLDFAAKKGFNALDASKWHTVTATEILVAVIPF